MTPTAITIIATAIMLIIILLLLAQFIERICSEINCSYITDLISLIYKILTLLIIMIIIITAIDIAIEHRQKTSIYFLRALTQ